MKKQPAIYLPHGGGPWPWMDLDLFGGPTALSSLRTFLEALPDSLPERPRAILCISAHWEEDVPTVSSAPTPPMLYDYSGFPENTYAIQWPAPGDPALAARVRDLLEGAGFQTGDDSERGFDHGTFVPLAVAWPEPDIPTVQLSLVKGLDPDQHVKIGQALEPLRDEGVLIVGSGMSYHNMRGFRNGAGARDAATFDEWLGQAMDGSPKSRNDALREWATAPAARASHPREEHLLPLMVVAGAGGAEEATRPFSDRVLNTRVSAFRLG